jgi:hypothetical protein
VRTRLLALVAATAPLLALSVATGSPATAQPGANCGAYPPGHAYGIRATTNHGPARTVTAKRGNSVLLTARVFRNGENCSGRSVKFFVHGPNEFNGDGSPRYHLTGSAVTDANGIAVLSRRVINSFRWYASYDSDNGTGTTTTRGADRLIAAI